MTDFGENSVDGWVHTVENSNVKSNMLWARELEKFLNSRQPEITNIRGSISSGVNIHLWVIPGNNKNEMFIDSIGPDEAVKGVTRMLDSRSGAPIGYSAGDSPVMWFVTYTDPKKASR